MKLWFISHWRVLWSITRCKKHNVLYAYKHGLPRLYCYKCEPPRTFTREELIARVEKGREDRTKEEAKQRCTCKRFAWQTALEALGKKHEKNCYYYREKGK